LGSEAGLGFDSKLERWAGAGSLMAKGFREILSMVSLSSGVLAYCYRNATRRSAADLWERYRMCVRRFRIGSDAILFARGGS
jgi:hypothetical protein